MEIGLSEKSTCRFAVQLDNPREEKLGVDPPPYFLPAGSLRCNRFYLRSEAPSVQLLSFCPEDALVLPESVFGATVGLLAVKLRSSWSFSLVSADRC